MTDYSGLVFGFIWALSLAVSLLLLVRSDSRHKGVWAILICLIPILGSFIYLAFGRNDSN